MGNVYRPRNGSLDESREAQHFVPVQLIVGRRHGLTARLNGPVAGLVGLFTGGWDQVQVVCWIVDGVVVGTAQGGQVREVAGATVDPMVDMVSVGVVSGSCTPREHAPTITTREHPS